MHLNIFELTIFINLLSGISCSTDCKKFLLHPDFLDDEKQPLLTKLFSKTSSCFASHKQTHQIAIENNINDLKNYFKDFSWIGPLKVTNIDNENANRIGLFFKAIMIPPTAIFEHKDDIGKIFNDDLCSLEGYFLPDYHQSNDIIDRQIMKTGLANFSILDKTKLQIQFVRNFTDICGATGCMIKYDDDDDFAVLHGGKIKKLSSWKEGTYVPMKAVCQSQLLTCEDGYRANFETFTCDAVCTCGKGQGAIGEDQGCSKSGENVCFSCNQDFELNGKFCSRIPGSGNSIPRTCVTVENDYNPSVSVTTKLNVKLSKTKLNDKIKFQWFNFTLDTHNQVTKHCLSKSSTFKGEDTSIELTVDDESASFSGTICFKMEDESFARKCERWYCNENDGCRRNS